MLSEELLEKKIILLDILKATAGCAVAFSAGVDSTFLLAAAKEALGDRVLAVTVKADWVPDRELNETVRFCEERGIEQVILTVEAEDIPGFCENPPERCYLCKKVWFGKIIAAAGERGYSAVVEGSNMDDLGDYRPGARAVEELGVSSPLRMAGLSKDEIRELSRERALPTWKKPSFACLASRVPYGEVITREKLRKIEMAEDFLLSLGFSQVRVRAHEGGAARIEVYREEMPRLAEAETAALVDRRLRGMGFSFVTMDLGGYRTGSLNPGA